MVASGAAFTRAKGCVRPPGHRNVSLLILRHRVNRVHVLISILPRENKKSHGPVQSGVTYRMGVERRARCSALT